MGLATEATIRARAIRDAGRPTSPSTCSGSTDARCSTARTRSAASCSPGSVSTAPHWQTPRHHVGEGEALWQVVRERKPGGDRRQAARLALPTGAAQPRLGQGPQPPRPGARDRRLDARRGQPRVAGSARCWSATGTRRRRRPSGWAPAAARLRGRRRHRLHPGDARAADGDAGAAPARAEPVRARRGPAGQVRAASPCARRRPDLGRAGAGLRGRVQRVDARGHPAPVLVQGPCATTRTRARSSARRLPDADRSSTLPGRMR